MSEHSNDQTDEQQQPGAAGAVAPDDRYDDTPGSGDERPGPSPSNGWRHRAYGIKGLAAVALASLILGGGAGAAIHAVADDDRGRDGRPGFSRDGGRGDGRPGDQRPVPPGGVPAPPTVPQAPATPPTEGASPDGAGATTSGSTT